MSFVEHYDGYYDSNDEAHLAWRAFGASEKVDNVLDAWHYVRGKTMPAVVDIGCGDGAIAAELSARNFYGRLDGFDVSSSGIAIAAARNLPRATFAAFEGAAVPAGQGAYDLAVLSHVVEHVEEPRALIREAARIAEWVIIEVPLEHNLRHLGDFQWTNVGHVNFYDPALIRQLVQSCGLAVHFEATTCPGRFRARTLGDRRAFAKWAIKQLALKVAPALSTTVMTYHRVLIAQRSEAPD